MTDDQPRKLLALQGLADTLEPFVDTYGLARVAEALALVCSAKADHIRESYSDEPLAALWDSMAVPFLKAEQEAEKLP